MAQSADPRRRIRAHRSGRLSVSVLEQDRTLRFAADRSLGKLCTWLRILGFDTLCEADFSGDWFKTLEGRILVTRIQEYRQRRQDHPLIFIRRDRVRGRLRQVIESVPLSRTDLCLFSRCVRCNLPLQPVDRSTVFGRVPEYIRQTRERFKECLECGRIYWRGSHGDAADMEIDRLFRKPTGPEGA